MPERDRTEERLSRDDREMLEAWLVGADFPMAPVVRRLLSNLDTDERDLAEAQKALEQIDRWPPGDATWARNLARAALASLTDTDSKPERSRNTGGCPEWRWDGAYRYRCGQGGSGGVCNLHGPFTVEARLDAANPQ